LIKEVTVCSGIIIYYGPNMQILFLVIFINNIDYMYCPGALWAGFDSCHNAYIDVYKY